MSSRTTGYMNQSITMRCVRSFATLPCRQGLSSRGHGEPISFILAVPAAPTLMRVKRIVHPAVRRDRAASGGGSVLTNEAAT